MSSNVKVTGLSKDCFDSFTIRRYDPPSRICEALRSPVATTSKVADQRLFDQDADSNAVFCCCLFHLEIQIIAN